MKGVKVLRAATGSVLVLFTIAVHAALASSPVDQFIRANGIMLQYVDWGGKGDVVLLLPGLGDDVHRFDAFAPRFSDRFHVVGFSRRGQGASDKPPAGYDTDTLVEDIRGVLDALNIGRVDLIGHSIAGMEMTRFAVKYPSRLIISSISTRRQRALRTTSQSTRS